VNGNFQERVNRLQAATAQGTSLEHSLLSDHVIDITPNATANAGSGPTWVVTLNTRRQAIFKPFGKIKASIANIYQQDRSQANVHEVIAWRLAHALGDPWDQLVPTAVLRAFDDIGPGVLINRRAGLPDIAVLEGAPSQVKAGAFWDTLIGQQDRHATNYRYDRTARRLALIDNAFAFARPGNFMQASMFAAHRKSKHQDVLLEREVEALEELLGADMHGLNDFLPSDRADALQQRARKILSNKRLTMPGAF
jgi:hypothetical protein